MPNKKDQSTALSVIGIDVPTSDLPDLPPVIHAGPVRYRVVLDVAAINARSVASGLNLDGECDHDRCVIHVHPELSYDAAAVILVHEWLHAMWHQGDDSMDADEEERMVRQLAYRLLDGIRRNPDLIGFLTLEPNG